MIANESHDENLTSKQQLLVALLVAGNSIVGAAKQAGIGEATAHRWRKLPAFQAEYEEARKLADEELWTSVLAEIRATAPLAAAALKRHLLAEPRPTAQSQMAAVALHYTNMLELHKSRELTDKIALIELAKREAGI